MITETTDLFPDLPPSLSPRLKWIEEHAISVRKNPGIFDNEEPYEAWIGDFTEAVEDIANNGDYATLIAFGATENEALARLAEVNGFNLWEGAADL